MNPRALLAFLTVGTIGVSAQRFQTIRFFTTPDCRNATGGVATPFYEFRDGSNVSFLGQSTTFLNSYCVLSGVWRVESAMPQTSDESVIAWGDGCVKCILSPAGQRRWGVIRHLGGGDITKPSISLYSDRNYLGRELQIVGNEFHFENPENFNSIAFTSYSSNWTWQIYNYPRFRGNYTCFSPESGGEVTLRPSESLSVGSLRLNARCKNASPPRFRETGFAVTIIFALIIPTLLVVL